MIHSDLTTDEEVSQQEKVNGSICDDMVELFGIPEGGIDKYLPRVRGYRKKADRPRQAEITIVHQRSPLSMPLI
jgi:hypothetical protein